MIYIGIDPGVKTGFAVWDSDQKHLYELRTLPIWNVFGYLFDQYHFGDWTHGFTIVIEDARKRGGPPHMAQGAGWVKTLSGQYEKYCKELGFSVIMVAPNRKTNKLSAESFKNLTGYTGRTSEHARDAAMLVWGR